MSKTCSKCNIVKDLDCYRMMKKYVRPECKACEKEYNYNYDRSLRGRYRHYRSGAKRRGYEFEITEKEFDEITKSGKCFYCGEIQDVLGVDRFDNRVGYKLWNVYPCCSMCNKMKNDYKFRNFVKKCGEIYNNFKYF